MQSMHSCQNSVMFSTRRSALILDKIRPVRSRGGQSPMRFRGLLGRISPKLVVNSSMVGAVIASGNVIATAAAVGNPGLHGAVSSAITQVAVSAVAIASGACLSTKVDFLWPKTEEQPGVVILDGVDITGYPIFEDPKVQEAIAFARKAHNGQFRKTGEPYLTHCIHTARIISVLVPSSGKRAVDTVVAGILHDVVDDTCESLRSIEETFGDDVATMVAGVSRLSFINQLLRRHRSKNVHQGTLGHEEANDLRVMLLGMIDDPRVVLIKLADRLHNMRTIYALPAPKAQAVAQETLIIWCSLASRLGLWALKAELEDLCFAVLQDLLEAVLPFDLSMDRQKRANFIHKLNQSSNSPPKPKVVTDAGVALASLTVCEEMLEREIFISTSYVPGMEVTLSSRLKSLYSVYSKMKRKDVGIYEIYDSRAMRVIVGDKNGTLHGPAIQCCYSLLDIIHRMWIPIDGEFDDYIVNPKPSGYQSLHTAVKGPDNAPLEVQIRTQRMHEYAEHGHAAHWLYKEGDSKLPPSGGILSSKLQASACLPSDVDNQNTVRDDLYHKYNFLKVGHPVLRVDKSHLLAAVVIRVEEGGKELLVAVSFGLEASEAVAGRRLSFQRKRWEAYARLYKKVSDAWWCEPGHGDWCTCLEKYTLCRDGLYHKQDQFQRLLPTFIQVIHLTDKEEQEYGGVVSAVFEGKELPYDADSAPLERPTRPDSDKVNSTEASINNKVHLLRTMLQWEEQLRIEAGLREANTGGASYSSSSPTVPLGEVVVVCWPHGEIMRLKNGSTAADAALRKGFEGKLVLVNGQLVVPDTQLRDGDVVEVRQ
uniref:GTP diphosphokinase n=1 Tax=Kalanchoe fedtschenkoi TaxID=63787 RepID=A0A7N0U717_KALFE